MAVETNGNGNGHAAPVAEELDAELAEEEADEDSTLVVEAGDEPLPEELSLEADPGAVRRYRFRHPTASGKTIAAAGFVEAARTLGVLILTHRRLLVSQFERDLRTEGYADRYTDAIAVASARPSRSDCQRRLATRQGAFATIWLRNRAQHHDAHSRRVG